MTDLHLKSSLRKHYDRHPIFVNHYRLSNSQMTTDMFSLSKSQCRSHRSFPHSCIFAECFTRITRRVSLVEQELLILPSSPTGFFFVAFVLCNFQFCGPCLVFFSFWPLYFLFVFPLRLQWYLQSFLEE